MEKEKRYRRYSLPVKLLILLVLIVSTIAAGVTGSRLIIGANYGMTFRELMNPVPYEESRQGRCLSDDRRHNHAAEYGRRVCPVD